MRAWLYVLASKPSPRLKSSGPDNTYDFWACWQARSRLQIFNAFNLALARKPACVTRLLVGLLDNLVQTGREQGCNGDSHPFAACGHCV
jgi:hypothetical protein